MRKKFLAGFKLRKGYVVNPDEASKLLIRIKKAPIYGAFLILINN